MDRRFSLQIVSSAVVFLVLLGTPCAVYASVTINEIAWMGTKESQFGEWIELYNGGSTEVDLSGAKLFEEGGQTLIYTLTKRIAAGGYLLLERTTSSSPDPVPGIADEAGPWGGGGLSNAGEYLVLKDKNGTLLDSVDASGGWPAGDNTTKETMQKSGSSWITATGTPDAKNASPLPVPSASIAATSSPQGASSAGVSSESAHSSSVPLSDAPIEYDFSVSAGRDRLATVGTPLSFEARTKGATPSNIEYRWSFGDGSSAVGKKVLKTFLYPGVYVAVLNAVGGAESAVARAKVEVVPLDVELRASPSDSRLEVYNASSFELNLGSWELGVSTQAFVLPLDTIILPKSRVVLPHAVTHLSVNASSTPRLLSPDGAFTFVGDLVLPLRIATTSPPTADFSRTMSELSAKIADISEKMLALGKELAHFTNENH